MLPTNIIDIKRATGAAAQTVQQLYAESLPQDVRLEEVEISEDGKFWFITMSFSLQLPLPTTPMEEIRSLGRSERTYKRFKIDAQTGQMRSMSIRKV